MGAYLDPWTTDLDPGLEGRVLASTEEGDRAAGKLIEEHLLDIEGRGDLLGCTVATPGRQLVTGLHLDPSFARRGAQALHDRSRGLDGECWSSHHSPGEESSKSNPRFAIGHHRLTTRR